MCSGSLSRSYRTPRHHAYPNATAPPQKEMRDETSEAKQPRSWQARTISSSRGAFAEKVAIRIAARESWTPLLWLFWIPCCCCSAKAQSRSGVLFYCSHGQQRTAFSCAAPDQSKVVVVVSFIMAGCFWREVWTVTLKGGSFKADNRSVGEFHLLYKAINSERRV